MPKQSLAPADASWWLPLAACAALVAGAPALAEPDPPATTSIEFNELIFHDLGIGLTLLPTAEPYTPHYRTGMVGFAAEPVDLVPVTPPANFKHFESGALRHTGGFALTLAGGEELSLMGFELRVGTPAYDWDLVDAAGRRWFVLENAMPRLSPETGEIQLLHYDVTVSPELAARIGGPHYTGMFAGAAHVVVKADVPSPSPEGLAPRGGSCIDDFSGDVDLEMVQLTTLSQIARDPGVKVALSFGARVENVGVAAIEWYRAIAPDGVVGPHPYLHLAMYRLSAGRLEQIGRAGVKHAFSASNNNCVCAAGQVLYPGCQDFYGATTNIDQGVMAPADEVSAFTGDFTSLGSHFDGSPVDDFRDHFGSADHDDYEHRLTVAEADLQTASAQWFEEAWYVKGDDIDIFNSMAHNEIIPSFGGSTWTFAGTGGMQLGSILDVFVDPVSPPPGSDRVLLDTGEGRMELAVTTADLGGGVTRFEYALMNFDFDRQVSAFKLPIPVGTSVSNVDSSDADGDALNDWTGAATTHFVRWSSPAGNELDWGSLYRFGFDADTSGVAGSAELSVHEAGTPTELAAAILAPLADFELEELALFGEAEGGSVEVTVEGVVLVVPTTVGQTVDQVLANVAAAILADPTLAGLGVTASSGGGVLSTDGAISSVVLSDAGLSTSPIAVPALSRAGIWAIVLLMTAAVVAPAWAGRLRITGTG